LKTSTPIAAVSTVFDAEDLADFRRAIARLRHAIALLRLREQETKLAWRESVERRRLALVDLLHKTGLGKSDEELIRAKALEANEGFEARVLISHSVVAKEMEEERQKRQEFSGALTERRRAVDELIVFLNKWRQRLPLFETEASS
jgi:hypothetical protein